MGQSRCLTNVHYVLWNLMGGCSTTLETNGRPSVFKLALGSAVATRESPLVSVEYLLFLVYLYGK